MENYEEPTTTNYPVEPNFLKSLKKEPARRTNTDLQIIYNAIRSFECTSRLEDDLLYGISQHCYYLKKSANDILYCRGELASQWFILISGSVFIDGSMFVPIACFGRRGASNLTRRPNECLILESSEMICMDYNDQYFSPFFRHSTHSSESSSAYSGSDTMGSSEITQDEQVDLSGLIESVVDSDDDFEDNNVAVRDAVRECLEKDPSERTEHDIGVLLEFTQHLGAFNDLTITTRKALCSVMVFAVVEKAGTVVLSDLEELDSWSVLVHGSVEVVDGAKITVLSAGDSFGLPPTLDKQYFHGLMRTRVDDCQFVCVTQQDYFRILKQGEDNQKRVLKNGKVVLITEEKSDNFRHHNQVIRGTLEELILQLVHQENASCDPTFVEDFLLTHRIFHNSHDLADVLLSWFHDLSVRDRVTRVVLLWVNNHFIDFEMDVYLMEFLQRFQALLEQQKDMSGQLRLLQIACSAKSRPRTIVLTRVSREDTLPFNIMGGADNGHGIYISHVESGTKASDLGLRQGDEVLQVNNQSFRSINLSRAFDILKGATHLVISVKCNFLGYHECINQTITTTPSTVTTQNLNLNRTNTMKREFHQSHKQRFKKALMKIHLLPKKSIIKVDNEDETMDIDDDNLSMGNSSVSQMRIDFPENVLKIYRSDQSFKYFLVNKETTAREVVMLALQEFQDLSQHPSRDYALIQVSCRDNILKQSRIPENLDSLAERLPLGSRYYIKKSDSSETLIKEDQIPEISKECEVSLLQLNANELALQLTLEDYAIFRQIEMTEFIDDLFNKKSLYGTPNLNAFAGLVNRETFWVVNEIVKEINVGKRVLMIKKFVKVATQCRECRNFNSMFAIISGLGHSSVSRLRQTWDKLPNKYQRLFNEMQELMDPSRNMGKYRALLAQSQGQTPMIPFYPVVRKDLTFIDLGNSTHIEELINFEKMRMVSKEIRQLVQMSAAPFDTSSQPTMAAMNQLTSNVSIPLTTTTGKSRGRRKNQGPPNPKKMFEDMNMVRKVKAYLISLEIISDENVLHEMSLSCEAAAGHQSSFPPPPPPPMSSSTSGSTATKSTTQRRMPSPTLSTSSSASSESTNKNRKFGTGSPNSYHKLLSLSEQKTKIHHKSPNFNRKLEVTSRTGSESSVSTTTSSSSHRLMLSTESSSVLPASSYQRNQHEQDFSDQISAV